MKGYTRSCERPRERSASEALPPSVSNRYALSIRTHGSSCRRRASSSLRRVSSFSALSSSSRAASHSSRVPVTCFVIALVSSLRVSRRRSALVLVVAAPPDAILVASPGGAVEPLVHAPEAVQAARIGGIGVVDDAVIERERAHARPLARVRGHVGSGHRRELGRRPFGRWRAERGPRRPVVVFDAPLALLLLGDPDVEVEVEVAAERGRSGECPPHAPLVRLQLRER